MRIPAPLTDLDQSCDSSIQVQAAKCAKWRRYDCSILRYSVRQTLCHSGALAKTLQWLSRRQLPTRHVGPAHASIQVLEDGSFPLIH